MKIAGIYKISRVGTDQCYVGSSSWITKRWAVHKRELRHNRHHASYLQNAWNKHGADAFKFSVLEICEGEALKELLLIREQHWMDSLKPCFNSCPAAASTLGFRMPREIVERHRQKITGRKLSPEHAAIVRGLALGLKRTPETKEKQRQHGLRRGMPALAIANSVNARRGKKLTPAHISKFVLANAGYTHSPDTIKKMKASNTDAVRQKKGAATRGKPQTPEHKERKRLSLLAYYQRKRLEIERATP